MPWRGVKGQHEGHCYLMGKFLACGESVRVVRTKGLEKVVTLCRDETATEYNKSRSAPTSGLSQTVHWPHSSSLLRPISLIPPPSPFFNPSIFSQHLLHAAAKTAGRGEGRAVGEEAGACGQACWYASVCMHGVGPIKHKEGGSTQACAEHPLVYRSMGLYCGRSQRVLTG